MVEKLLSVGIDIGTSTTQMILSYISFENLASSFTVPRIVITDKEVIYKSEILITPIIDDLIQTDLIQRFIDQEYQKAGINKQDIKTGAVIITGESARKQNAENVTQALSGYAGDFVVATAGPDLESIIAGKGSGAFEYSSEHHTLLAHLDIGGGTTNIVVFDDGNIVDTGCFDVGGRQIKVDQSNKVTYLAPKVQKIVQQEGLSLAVGQVLNRQAVERIAEIFVDVLKNAVGIGEKSPYFDLLVTHKPLNLAKYRTITNISFSGGVADCINVETNDEFKYGDIGFVLGKAIKQSSLYRDLHVVETKETIRATVVGAGSHTIDVSGSTVTFDADVLPIKNIATISFSNAETDALDHLADLISERITWHTDDQLNNCALSFAVSQNPKYQYIMDLGDAIIAGSKVLIEQRFPLVVVVQEDIAKSLGHYLRAQLKGRTKLICIDKVITKSGDYIDIGYPIANGEVLPVVVKTLVYI